jgi:hypothetical protein
MTDFMAVTFLVALAIILWIVATILKNTFMMMASGLSWAISAIYLFSKYYSGDLEYGPTVYGFAWVCALCAFGTVFQTWWTHRAKTLAMTGEKDPFYNTEDMDFKEIRDMYKARDDRNSLRGRKRR